MGDWEIGERISLLVSPLATSVKTSYSRDEIGKGIGVVIIKQNLIKTRKLREEAERTKGRLPRQPGSLTVENDLTVVAQICHLGACRRGHLRTLETYIVTFVTIAPSGRSGLVEFALAGVRDPAVWAAQDAGHGPAGSVG